MIALSAAFFLIGLFSELLSSQLLISNFIVQASLTHFISSLLIVFSYHLFLNRCIKEVDWSFYLFLLANGPSHIGIEWEFIVAVHVQVVA